MIQINGSWIKGYAFDIHTLSSEYTGDNEFGHPTFDTKRTQIGQYLYEFKYGQKKEILNKIADLISDDNEFKNFITKIEIILPVPPSRKNRQIQPVIAVSDLLSKKFNKTTKNDILISTNKEELKNIATDERYEKIKNNIKISENLNKDTNILIIDDVFDSGATLEAFTNALKEHGYNNVYVFTLTKTRKAD